MLEPIMADHLVICKVDSPLHLGDALLRCVAWIDHSFTKFTTTKMCDKWPSVVPIQAWFVLRHHVFEFLCQNSPVALEVVGAL